MKKLFLVVALSITASMMAYGQTISGMGATNCGKWVNSREKSKENPWPEISNISNLVGYLSGLAMMDLNRKGTDPLQKVSGDSITLWMDNYCRGNPLNDIYHGGYELYFELKRKAGWKP